jgi:hypothetical protein
VAEARRIRNDRRNRLSHHEGSAVYRHRGTGLQLLGTSATGRTGRSSLPWDHLNSGHLLQICLAPDSLRRRSRDHVSAPLAESHRSGRGDARPNLLNRVAATDLPPGDQTNVQSLHNATTLPSPVNDCAVRNGIYLKRAGAGHHLMEHHAERPDIRTSIDLQTARLVPQQIPPQ